MLFRQGRFVEAHALFLKVLLTDPQFAAAALNGGAAAACGGQPLLAVRLFSWATHLEPGSPVGYIETAKANLVAEAWGAALEGFSRGLCHAPASCEVLTGWATALRRSGNSDRAVRVAGWACAADPLSHQALGELGDSLREEHAFLRAIDALGRSAALKPDQAGALLTLAYCHLHLGVFERGWRLHEHRWRDREFLKHHRDSPLQRWRGQVSIKGRPLLVFSEQGFGDTIQFVRFVAELKPFGADVTLMVPSALSRLLSGFPGADRIVSSVSSQDIFAACCSLMSLPDILRTDRQSIPFKDKPYLFASSDIVDCWRMRLRCGSGRRIGVCWSGAPNPRMTERSIPLAEFSKIFVQGDEYYSLHKDVRDSDLWALRALDDRLLHFDGLHEDFAATAGLIEHMDVVISVDTAVAHLAAAMGKETWILLPWRADWRWLEECADSPWYSKVRLFRQDRDRTWDGALRRVRTALE